MIFFKFRIIYDNRDIYVPGKYTQTLPPSVKNDTADNLLLKDRKRKMSNNANPSKKQKRCNAPQKPIHGCTTFVFPNPQAS